MNAYNVNVRIPSGTVLKTMVWAESESDASLVAAYTFIGSMVIGAPRLNEVATRTAQADTA